MSGKYFTEDEVQFLIGDCTIEQYEGENRRWSRTMTNIVVDEDGKLYSIDWEQGLTEGQESTIDGGTYEEVFKYVKTIGTVKTSYLTKKYIDKLNADNDTKLSKAVDSLKVIADESSFKEELDFVNGMDLDNMIYDIQNIDLLNATPEMRVNNELTLKYLNSLKEVKNLIQN